MEYLPNGRALRAGSYKKSGLSKRRIPVVRGKRGTNVTLILLLFQSTMRKSCAQVCAQSLPPDRVTKLRNGEVFMMGT